LERRISSRRRLCSSIAGVSTSPVRSGDFVVLLAVLIAVLLCGSSAMGAPNDITVEGIAVAGNQRVSEAAVINTFGLAAGETYAYDEVRNGLRRVYDMGFFDDVGLVAEEAPGGYLLTLEVKERPVVGAVKITGSRKIGKGDIREKVQLSVGSSLEERLVFHSVAAIDSLYRDKGYYIAKVDYQTEPINESTVELDFNIDEGAKVKVGKISIEGNRSLSAKAIRKVMETKEKGWFTHKDFNPEVFDEDVGKIEGLYKDNGFREARVVSHDVEIDSKKALADLTVTVEEGPRTYFRKVDVVLESTPETQPVLSQEALAGGIDLTRGMPFSQDAYDKNLENLYSMLGEYGFVYATIEPTESVDHDSLDLTLNVVPERAVHVNKILIEGNETTFDKVIRRELLIKPGDILRRSLIERSHREVFNLGYFEDVQVSSKLANDEGDVDLIFKIKERQIGVANVGAGYSEEFGLTGFLEFSHNNIGWFRKFPYLGLGKGENINLRWEFGKLTQIELSYRNPWFRDRPTLVGFDLYDTKTEYDTYTQRRDGFGLIFGRRLPYIDYSRVYVRYSLERRELDPDEDKASEALKAQAGTVTTSSTLLTFIRDSVDNPFFPRTGSRTTLTCEVAGGLLGGTTAYQSYILEASDFMPVPLLSSALVLTTRVGVVDELGGGGYIPVYERFRLGGTTVDGVRGYSEYEIVPEGNAIDIGGRFMVIGTLEYRVPVVKNRAHLLAFLDAGNTWDSFQSARPGFLRRSAGLGFRVEIPMMGQLGLDMAYGFDREDRFGAPGWKTHFQFGTSGY
jgi:outer membrane protein insertion porin family